MTLNEQIMKLQTYKMFEGEDTVYVERDDVLKLLEQMTEERKAKKAIDIMNDVINAENIPYEGTDDR